MFLGLCVGLGWNGWMDTEIDDRFIVADCIYGFVVVKFCFDNLFSAIFEMGVSFF